jgi:hypothetical protein
MKPLSILVEYDAEGNECYSHPYAFEIDNFRIPARQFEGSILRNSVLAKNIFYFKATQVPSYSLEGFNLTFIVFDGRRRRPSIYNKY